MKLKNWCCSYSKLIYARIYILLYKSLVYAKHFFLEKMDTLISTFHFWLHNYTARLSNVLNVKGDSVVCPESRQHWGTNRLTNTILQGLMMVSIHGPDDSEFDFMTAMNIWGKLRKRHILVEKAKESTEKSKLLKKNCDEISFAKENYKRKKN